MTKTKTLIKTTNILSLGAGVQSSTILFMVLHKIIKKPDYVIFADTGWEPKKVYQWLDFLIEKSTIQIHIIKKGNIKLDTLSEGRSASLPFYLENGGKAMRQCTNDYKIKPILKKTRDLIGIKRLSKYQKIRMWLGISIDEIQRMKKSNINHVENYYPLIEQNMDRNDCVTWMKNNGYPEPPKSSCIGCPFHSSSYWNDMAENNPQEFKEAVEFDENIRIGKLNYKQFLHYSRKPLKDINTCKDTKQTLWSEFTEECDGYCGI